MCMCVFYTDIDECSQSIGNLCAFQCVNTAGSYQCACPPHGYVMAANGRTCKGEADIYSNRLLGPDAGYIFVLFDWSIENLSVSAVICM